jgi:magnesium transporter
MLEGVVTLRDLVLNDPEKQVGEVMDRRVVAVKTEDDQEVVARLIHDHDLLAVPVLDRENRLVGIVTVDDAVDVLEEEVSEDFQRIMAVSGAAEGGVERYFDLSFFTRITRRLPWLAALLAAEAVSGKIIGTYEKALGTAIVLAMFIPMITGTTGNAGSQTTTLIVRAMATGELTRIRALRMVGRELATLFLLGLTLGLAAFALAWGMTREVAVALIVGATLVLTVNTSSFIALILPLLLRALRSDHAVASAPLIATISDAVSLFLYFSVARYLLSL